MTEDGKRVEIDDDRAAIMRRAFPDSHQDRESDEGWRFECDWCGRGLVVEVRTLTTAIELVEGQGWEHKRCGVDWCGTCNKEAFKGK